MLINLNQHQTGAEDGEGIRPSADTGDDLEEKTRLSAYDNCKDGVGGSNLGQTQVELSGLNHVGYGMILSPSSGSGW